MGLYGWQGSPYEDMDSNVGLHDSVTALEWTKTYISKFGGDPSRITAIGQSAGAGIITLMLTSNGGKGEIPFQQVRKIPTSLSTQCWLTTAPGLHFITRICTSAKCDPTAPRGV